MSLVRSLRGWAVLAVVVLLALFAVTRGGGVEQRSITAHFASAPGLYVGNQVAMLGMPIGKVKEVTPRPSGVDIRFEVPGNIALPDQVQVMLMAPNLISDRFLELTPAYTSGAKLSAGAEIPIERTRSPLSADQIIKSVDKLAQALGPNGANAAGDLNDLLHSLATSFGPDGKPLNDTITNFGQALGALSAQGPDLTTLLDSLSTLTHAASTNLDQYRSFAGNLATVSATLASEKTDIAQALASLNSALAALSTFVTDNAATLGGSVAGLNTFAQALSRQQAALGDTFRTLPVALQNLHNAVDPNAPGGPALTVRYDATSGDAAFGKEICGNPVLRLLSITLATAQNPDDKPGQDLVCGLNGVVSQLPATPGANGPDMSLQALIGGAQ